MPCPDDFVAPLRTDFKQFTQASQRVADILDDAADNAIVASLIRTIQTLRVDADRHGELLATLCIPQNRATIRGGDAKGIDRLFDMIDTYSEHHKALLAKLETRTDGT